MKKCPNCGAKNNDNAKFCVNCGLSFTKYKQMHQKEKQSNQGHLLKCPNCGKPVRSGLKFCPNCGHRFLNQHRCPNCGAKVHPDAKFCPHCGHKLTQAAVSQTLEHHGNVGDQVSNQDYYTDEVEGGQHFADVDKSKSVHRNWLKRYFSASFLLFWIKGNISVNYREIRIKRQNTVFMGLIPAGSNIINIPLKQVSSASINVQYKIVRFILGFLIAYFGLMFMNTSLVFGLIILAMGIVIFTNGLITQLSIEQTAGVARKLEVPIYDRSEIEIMRSAINQALSSEEDKTDLGMYFNKHSNSN